MFETPQEHRRAFVDLAFRGSLRKLNGRGLYRLLSSDKKEKSQRYELGFEWLLREPIPTDRHVFVSPTLRTGVGYPGKADGVIASSLLWVDVDDKGLTLTQAVGIATELGVPPSAVIQSGRHADRGHLYWGLDAPVFVDSQGDEFGAMLVRLKDLLKGDPQVAKVGSLMRMPGSWNVKSEYGDPAPMCRFIEFHRDRVYGWGQLDSALPSQPSPPRSSRKAPRRPDAALAAEHLAPESTGAGLAELGLKLQNCDFFSHCVSNAPTLSEGLWVDMIWNLVALGGAGEALAVQWSRPHPAFSVAETLEKFRFARGKGYSATCTKVVNDGFECPKYDSKARRCSVFPARFPRDLAGDSTRRDVWILGRRTWKRGRDGDRCVAQYIVRIDREVRSPDGTTLIGRAVTVGGRSLPLQFPAQLIGDPRAANRMLAGVLGSSFICDRRRLDDAWQAWLGESEVVVEEVTHDFGFSSDGKAFSDSCEPIPLDTARFIGPPGSPAGWLGLAKASTQHSPAQLASELLRDWPKLNGPEVVEFLLGCAGWSLVAPVLEAQPGVEALIAWLAGKTGRGKSTHCVLAQCLFGQFHNENSIVHFASTAFGVEDQAYWFHGALMLVDDVKKSAMPSGGMAGFLSLVQRAYGRAGRQKLTRQGQSDASKPCRATLLFNGEDMILTESSALARVLTFEIGARHEDLDTVERLEELRPRLSELTRGFLGWLMGTSGWAERAGTEYRSRVRWLASRMAGGPNKIRLAKSAAAVLVGLDLWLRWLEHIGVEHGLELARLQSQLVGQATDQMGEVDASSPGERFLELLQVAFEAGRLRLVEDEHRSGDLVGRRLVDTDGEHLVCVMFRASLPVLRTLLEDGECLPPQTSIRKSLQDIGALGGCNEGRRTRAVRLGNRKRQTWPIRRRFLFPEEVE